MTNKNDFPRWKKKKPKTFSTCIRKVIIVLLICFVLFLETGSKTLVQEVPGPPLTIGNCLTSDS